MAGPECHRHKARLARAHVHCEYVKRGLAQVLQHHPQSAAMLRPPTVELLRANCKNNKSRDSSKADEAPSIESVLSSLATVVNDPVCKPTSCEGTPTRKKISTRTIGSTRMTSCVSLPTTPVEHGQPQPLGRHNSLHTAFTYLRTAPPLFGCQYPSSYLAQQWQVSRMANQQCW